MLADRTVRDAHIRSINCIRINPTLGYALLTASQDGYVKYWVRRFQTGDDVCLFDLVIFMQDLRTFKLPPAVQIPHHGTAVRALAFNPGSENDHVLVGLETGALLRYDLRAVIDSVFYAKHINKHDK